MATRTWQSVASTDWNTAGNWSGAAVPVTNDNVVINGGTTIAGYDASAVDLDSLNVGQDHNAAIGSTGSYLIVAADLVNIKCATQATILGSRNIYLDTGGTYTSDVVYVDSTAVNQKVYLKGTITDLVINHGRVVLVSGTVAELRIVWDGTGSAPVVEINTPTVTLAHIHSAADMTMTQAGTITTLRQDAGTLTASAGTLTNVYVGKSGTLRDNTTTTTTLAHVYPGGLIDYRQNVTGKTVTASEAYGTGRIAYDQELGRITFTAPIVRRFEVVTGVLGYIT